MLLQLIMLLPYTKQVDKHIDCLPLQPFLVFPDITQFFNLDISYITQFFHHVKSSSILQFIKGKSRDLQKLLRYFNGATSSTFMSLLSGRLLLIIFVLYSKYLLAVVFLSSHNTSITIFTHVIIQFISILIPQTCCCHRSCPYTITDYTSTYQNFLQCIANKCVIDFGYTWPKRYIILKG